jgi:hypothetical protein
MRTPLAALAALATTLLLADATAQGGRFRRAEEITNRVGVFFADQPGPTSDGDKVAGLETTEFVRAAVAARQPTVLYLVDGKADEEVRGQFERQVFASDELGITLRCFHCGRLDLAKETALAAQFGKKAPLFVVFDAEGKATEVSMVGYKPSTASLQKALDKAGAGTVKPSLGAFAKQYAGMVRDLEQLLGKQKQEQEKLARAAGDANKKKAIEKELAGIADEMQKLLDKENEFLAKHRLPERPSSAQRLGTWRPRRDEGDGGGRGGAGGGTGRGGD